MSAAGVTFRTILIRWLLGVAAMVGLPGVFVEATRPWGVLDGLVRTSEALVGSAVGSLQRDDLLAMNALALAVSQGELQPPAEAAGPGWVMLVMEGRPLTLEEARARAPEAEVGPIVAAAEQWQATLSAWPGGAASLAAYQRARPVLANTMLAAGRVDLAVDDVYLTVDLGPEAGGFFTDNIAFVSGALPWWDDTIHPGQAFDVRAIDGDFWRASYLPSLGGQPESFGHNPYHDPIFPRFEKDEWGTWFSVWASTRPAPDQFDSLTMDIDAAAVVAEMWRAVALSLSMGVGIAGLTALVARRVARRVSRPVAELQRGATAVMAQNYEHVVPPVGQGELLSLIQTFNEMIRLLRERVNLLGTLEKLLSKELAQAAAREGLSLGGREVNATVMFTDFASFSTIAQSMRAVDVVEALNAYFGVLVPLIKQSGGLPDKYIGDAIVAIFGAPVPLHDHADRALQCAVAMQRALRTLNNQRRAEGKVIFEMRIGLDTGLVVAGAIGCDDKLEFTSIGESTNLANRMEAACPVGHVQLSASTHSALVAPLPSGARAGELLPILVKGYDQPVVSTTIWVDDLVVDKTGSATEPYHYSVRAR